MTRAFFRHKGWIFAVLALLLGGCAEAGRSSPKAPAGGSAPPTAQSSGGDEVQSSTSSTEAAPAEPGAQPAPAPPPPSPASTPSRASAEKKSADAPSSRGSARREPAPESRPGLGTEFGEARTSRVHDVAFVRDSSRPFATATLNYNDRRGVDALAARASSRSSGRSLDAAGGAVTVSIRDSNGDPLEAVRVGDRTFVVGQAGQRYSIVLQNHTSHRFEAVATVDGLDVINGKPGTFDNRGYVLMPFATVEIDGFRTSTSSVAAFRFAAVADSYAAQMGSARNVGVIGVAFFAERGDSFVPESETRLRDTASPFPADPRFAPPPPRR